MKLTKLLFCFLLIVTSSIYAQNEHKFVKLEEIKKGKRLDLYANNTGEIAYDVFLKVDTDNYRRSSNRPIIRTIAPNTRLKLITLIQLKDKPETYNSVFIVNEVAYALDVQKDKEQLDFKIDDQLKQKKVTLFTKDDCVICPNAKAILNKNNIPFNEYNVDKDTTNYNKLIKEFKAIKPNSDFNRIPILKVENQIFNTIETLDDFVNALRVGLND
ncbi:glutaredoxin family protein [Lacinutrix salivirga]